MAFEFAERLRVLPPYLFAELDRRKQEKISEGVDVIDLGVGDPDLPTPEPVVEALREALTGIGVGSVSLWIQTGRL